MGIDAFAGGDSSSGSIPSFSGGSLWDSLGISQTQAGGGLSAAGDLIGGISSFMSGAATGHKLKDAARRVDVATSIKLLQQQRMGYRLQGQAEAAIGAAGGTVGGSAESILRMNASNLALDHGIIQAQGSEEAAQLRAAASASFASGWGGLLKGVGSAIGAVAAS